MQEKELEKFIVFVESMRNGDNDAEIDVILEGFFNVYGNKNQFPFNTHDSAMKVALNSPFQVDKIWPRLYANTPEILIAALRHSDPDKAEYVHNFIKKYSVADASRKGTLGEVMEKAVQAALKKSNDLQKAMQIFATNRAAHPPMKKIGMSRSQDKAFEKAWAAKQEEIADRMLREAGI